eukprot:scaffold311663_cov43-Prasinocladus_malaysianus.AAC.1
MRNQLYAEDYLKDRTFHSLCLLVWASQGLWHPCAVTTNGSSCIVPNDLRLGVGKGSRHPPLGRPIGLHTKACLLTMSTVDNGNTTMSHTSNDSGGVGWLSAVQASGRIHVIN